MEKQFLSRKPYPIGVSDEEWQFIAPKLAPMKLDAPQRRTAFGWRSSSFPKAKCGFVLLPRRWVERFFAWMALCWRLAKDDERLPETLARLQFVAIACLMLQRLLTVAAQSP